MADWTASRLFEPNNTLICDPDAANKDCTTKLMVDTNVDCLTGNDSKTGAGIDDNKEQKDTTQTASAGGRLEINGLLAT
jgi:hypothetical protein